MSGNRGAATLVGVMGLAAWSVACNSTSSPVAPGNTPPPGATQQCRTYATAWTTRYTFATPTSASAVFSEFDRTYREFSPAGSSQLVRRVTYSSVADFVDEAATFGRFLNRRTEMCPERNQCLAGLLLVETPAYDRERRRAGLTVTMNAVPLYTEEYDGWDGQGRPTGGTRAEFRCLSRVSLMYDEATRTLASATGPGSDFFCLSLGSGNSQTFDPDGNLIGETTAVGGTSTTATHTITATSQVCK